ncbi:unnamed protein product [Cyprideis torosa]|uniref:VTT domain-containing protein n=1 Tax=Cyprideis torosa TaxID=163714 RepID=A0A7R8ZW81_9CRUS|nr:unnamed protein product [Cyprideis torosa]CAG0911064.1 unnamed protein product [Cyprideis torosa]
MTLFGPLYLTVLAWAAHRHAPRYLAALSFAESSFFPIPVDVMLAPMVLAKRQAWIAYALTATIFSVLGGVAGYLIGVFALELVQPWLDGHLEQYEIIKQWFAEYGVWVVFLAGFSPIPFKLFTVTAGALGMPLIPFILTSLVGRGARFFLVAGLVAWGGDRLHNTLQRYVEFLGWAAVLIVGAGLYYLTQRGG